MKILRHLRFVTCLKYISILLLIFGCSLSAISQKVNNGIIDLRDCTNFENDIINISGKWQIYYGKHLDANQMKSIPAKEKQYILVPDSWNNYGCNKAKYPTFGIGTYYLKIILNKKNLIHDTTLGFKLANIISSYRLYANNKLITEAGKASKTIKNFKPTYLPQTCYFETNKDTLDIIIQVSNFKDPVYAGIWQKIYFGKKKVIAHYDWTRNALSFFILSAFIFFFLYQLTLSISQKNEKSHIIIALLALISFIKLIVDGEISIFNFIPDLNFDIYYKLWTCTFLIIPLTLRLTKISFPNEVNKYIENAFYVFYSASAFAFIFIDVNTVLTNLNIVIYGTFLCSIYMFYILIKAVIRSRKYSVLAFIGFTIMIAFIVNDLIFLTYQYTVGYLSHVGILLYITIQTVTISQKFAYSHKKVFILSEELIKSNQNLERLISERTKELNEANVELIKLNKQKDFLISTISHDLMGFFNTLLTFTKALTADKSMPEKHQPVMSKLYLTSNKGFLLLDNILTWAKLQIGYQPEMKTIKKLSYIIDENLYLFDEQLLTKAIETDIKINDDIHFECNIGNLNTILRNLISNAIKFSLTNGKISIINELKHDVVQIRIHDHGIGMLYDELITLFDPEKTNKREGTAGERGSGLGLMIVKELVESNNGKIYCNSQLNHGTSFILEFKHSKN